MKIKDLTIEQVKEIVKLAYPFEDWIKSEIEVKYQPYDETWLDDAAEFWFVKFQGITFGNKVDTYRLWIHPTLDLAFNAIRTDENNMTEEQKKIKTVPISLGSFPIRNQHQIQKKFMEWNIQPTI